MPLWKIYHPENAFSDDDKQAIAERVTALYTDLPKFYVGLVFQPVPKASFFIGGQRADDFVRIAVDHIARQIHEDEIKRRFLGAVGSCWRPISPSADCAGKSTSTRRRSACGPSRTSARPCPARPSERWREQNRPTPA